MTASVTGTAYTGSGTTASGAKSVSNVTIPAGANGALIFFGYYVSSGGTKTVSAVTLDGQTATKEVAYEVGGSTNNVSVWSVSGFSTGSSKTLAWTNDQAMSDGVTLEIVFVTDCDPSDVVTSSAAAATAGSPGTATTASLTVTGTQLIVSGISYDNTATPSFGTGQTLITGTATSGTTTGQASQETRSGNDTQAATGDFVAIGAVVISNAPTGSTEQEGARWGVDDANEASHTWEASQDTDITIAANQARLLRVLVNATGDPASFAYTLNYQKNGSGGYVPVPVGSTTAEIFGSPSFGAIGTGANGSTTVAPSYPAGISAGDYLVAVITSGATNSETPADSGSKWGSPLATGASTDGTYGVDAGPRRVTVFGCVADGTESGAYTFNITNGGTCRGTISRFSKSGSGTWTIDAQGANDSGAHTSISMTFASMNWNTGDLALVATGQRVDNATQSAQSLTASGVTFGARTNRAATAVTTGNDHRHSVDTFAAVSATSNVNAAPTWAYTASAAASAGGVIVRLREYTAAVNNEVYVVASGNIAGGGEATTARLTAPSGKSTSDFDTGRRWDDENGSDSIDITVDNYTELEWSVMLASSLSGGDYADFRVYAGASPLDTYTVTPRWTVGGGNALAAAGTAVIVGSAALTSVGTLAAAGALTITGATALKAVGTIAASGNVVIVGSAALTASGTLAGAGAAVIVGSASLTAQGTLSASGTVVIVGAADLTSPSSNDVASAGTLFITGAAGLTAQGTLAAAGTAVIVGTSALTAVGTLAASGTAVIVGAADLTAPSANDISAAGTLFITGSSSLTATGDMAAAGSVVIIGSASLGDGIIVQPDQSTSGGWLAFNARYEQEYRRRRRERQEREEREEEAKELQDRLDREIALLLRKQEAEDARRAELARLKTLADGLESKEAAANLGDRVAKALERATLSGGYSALEALEREIERAIQEEDAIILAITMILSDE